MSNIAVHRLHNQQLEHTWLEKLGDVARYLGPCRPRTTPARNGRSVYARRTAETLEGRIYWSSPWIPEGGSSMVYLVPGFDEYLLSYRDRGASLDPVHAKSLSSGGGVRSPAIVADGRVVGTWKRTFEKDTVVLTVTHFAPLSEVRNAAVEHFCRFVGMPATVVT